MIFDILKIGATFSNNSLTDDAYYYNNKLYTIPEFTAGISKNINVYDISDYKDYKSTVSLECNHPLYDQLDVSKYILIQTDGEYSSSSNVSLISTDMSRYYYIDTNTNTATKEYINETINFESMNFNSDKLYSKTIYHNNKVYSIPYNTSNIGIYDGETSYLCNININGNELFNSGIINDNKLYLIPYNYSNVLVYDIDTISLVSNISIDVDVDKKYSHAVEYNDDIYCIPFNADHILKIDVYYNTNKIYDSNILKSINKYSYGVLNDINNCIYLIPADNQKIAYYDIENKTLHEILDIMYGDLKFSSGVKIDDKIYLIPHNFDKIVTIDTSNNIEELFSFAGIRHPNATSNTLFSEAYHDNNNKTLYMIPDNCGYIGVLKYPYDSIDRFYTINIFLDQYDVNKSIIGSYYDNSLHLMSSNLHLMSSGYHEPVVDITLNKRTYNLQNKYITTTKNHEKDINDTNFIFRNYVSGFYYDNCFYLLEASGKYITKIEIDTDNITDIEIYKDNRKGNEYRNEINFNNIVKVSDILYTVIGNNNIFSKYNIKDNTKEYLDLQQYNFTSTDKFRYGLYSKFSNKVYLIPYNIPKIGIIDSNDKISYIELDNLKDINSLFQFAIENNGYIYLIPYSSDFIYILNVVDEKLTKIDISVYNLNKKFIKAFKYDKKIILVSSDLNKLVFLDYDLLTGATLEDNANFNLITKNLFKSDGNTDVINIGINTKYSATYRNGRLFINLHRETNAEDKDIYNWKFKSSILVDKHKSFRDFIQDKTFIDDNNETIFTIDDPDGKFNIDDFLTLTGDEIQQVSVTNIYSLGDNSIYFIPYNYKYLLKLDLSQTPNVLKIIDITKDQDILFINFMTNGNVKGKFNLAIIVDDVLYMIPYVEEASINYYPLVEYNIIKNIVISVTDLNKYITFGFNSRKLFSSVLKYNRLLYLTQRNGNKVVSYNIDDNNVNNVTIESAINCLIIDGYINNNNNNIYFLKSDDSQLISYEISESGDFIGRQDIDLKNQNSDKYSKIISNQSDTKLYLIPYDTNELCIYSFDGSTNAVKKKEISRYGTNGQLFKGGLTITLEDEEYLIMIPHKADSVCIYNITNETFAFIKDPLFITNDFENCTIDLHGNLCMNTAKGNVLFYKLSIKKTYLEARKPVELSTNSRISFKDLYQKFHTDYIYEKYNFANKSIKFSDYFNNGGSTYFTMGKFKKDKYIVDNDNDNDNDNVIPDAKYTESITTYNEFIQCNVDNRLELSEYRSAHSAVYENYILLDNNEYKISSISISKGYFYYVEKNDTGEITLKGKEISSYEDIGNSVTIEVTNKRDQSEESFRYELTYYSSENALVNEIGNASKNKYYKIIIEVDDFRKHSSKLELSMSDFNSNIFENLQEIEFNIINGTLTKGIEINIDDTIGENLRTITVLNKPLGVIKFDDGLNNLITINSSITSSIDVNLKESIVLEELELIVDSIPDLQKLQTTIIIFINDDSNENRKKVSKIIVKINHIPTSDTSISLDLFNICDRVPYCHTLVIITKSDKISINFTGNNIKNNLNVIVYENI